MMYFEHWGFVERERERTTYVGAAPVLVAVDALPKDVGRYGGVLGCYCFLGG
jgi:hypothetical protein